MLALPETPCYEQYFQAASDPQICDLLKGRVRRAVRSGAKNLFPPVKRNPGAEHYPGERQNKNSEIGRPVGTAVATINPDLRLTKPAAASERAKGKYENFQALVMQALQMRRTYREVFILCDIRGYSAGETAAILGIHEDSVARRLARARDLMGLSGDAGASVIAELVDF